MFSFSDKNYFYILFAYLILTAGYLFSEYIITDHFFGVPLDDVWIHFRFAENFANGFFYQYNPGEPTPGTTSPLWVIILSLPFLFSAKLILPYALIISSAFLLLTCTELYRLCKRLGLNKSYSLLAAMLTLLCGRLLWSSLSGMEITFFCYLSVLIIKLHLSELKNGKINILTGLLLGLAVNTRPEAYLLAVIYFTATVYLFKESLKKNLSNLLFSFIIFLLLIIPYPLFSYIYSGSILPNTYKGQVFDTGYLPNITYLIETGKLFFRDNVLILILWFVSIFYFISAILKRKLDKNYLVIYLWIILLPAVSSIIASNWRHHGRYLIPIIPFINIAAVSILQIFFQKISSKFVKMQKYIKSVSVAVILLLTLNSSLMYAITLGWNVENINNQQVRIANWLKSNLTDESAFGMNDIGAITFITKKKVVDMAGLVTPQVFQYWSMSYEDGANSLLKLLKENGVNYIIIYPHWYEYIMQNYSHAFEPVYSAKIEKNTICGGTEMFVYKINWDKIKLN